MPIARIKDIRKWSTEELEKKLLEYRSELLEQRALQASGGAIENPGRIKEIKKTIARILTVINERKRGSEKQK
ncbi:MAG: 50S ribosomal protein L29 [Candidatus Freyarchaeota archaeon]|nr:50S ribosomal protein L29 [Candidatus Freyarchaeota archaeon]